MKKILIILLFVSIICKSQLPQINFIKEPKDYNLHYGISALMSCFFISSAYYLTDKKGLSILGGAGLSLSIGIIGKEYIHDKWLKHGVFSNRDIEADALGTLCGTYVASVGLLVYSKRQKVLSDTLKFQNLNSF